MDNVTSRFFSVGPKFAFIAHARHEGRWLCYFRVFGYGLCFSNAKRRTFSERMGIRKVWRVRGLVIETLTPGT
jgi:hypothetical protein